MSDDDPVPRQSAIESASIAAMSRPQVVEAYETWTQVSESEAFCVGAAINPDVAVLDLGCGAGRLADWMNGRFASYLGIDASEAMIQAAQKKHPELQFMAADIFAFDAKEASFDLILLLGNVLDYLHPEKRRSALLERCFKWLRPGSSVVGSSHLSHLGQGRGYYAEEYHGSQLHQFRSSASEMVREIESHGFEVTLLSRDGRKEPADWANWVATRPKDNAVGPNDGSDPFIKS